AGEEVMAAAAPPPVDLVLQTTKATTEVGDGLLVSSAAAEPPISPSQLPNELKLQTVVTTPAPAEGENKPKAEGGDDMFSKIFNKEEEQENPLAALMASLPDISLKDLLEEAREVAGMLGEWQQN
ncbi:MAG: hypothetical protein Q7R57_03480, partial [Dehalococcoidales bacterium]|nr:hypothetical protein [Dehalococcoidales bacterium]